MINISLWFSCDDNCTAHCDNTTCSQTEACVDSCRDGLFGQNCSLACPIHCLNSSCGRENGTCLLGCEGEYFGDTCELSKYIHSNDTFARVYGSPGRTLFVITYYLLIITYHLLLIIYYLSLITYNLLLFKQNNRILMPQMVILSMVACFCHEIHVPKDHLKCIHTS